jgi:hypothetical protein
MPALTLFGAWREETAQAGVRNGGNGIGGFDDLILVVLTFKGGLDTASIPAYDLERGLPPLD